MAVSCKNNNTTNCDDNDDAVDTEDEPVYCPDRNELLQIIETKLSFAKILVVLRR